MKKNKTVAFMLAATLLVGGTFIGTRAMFYDEAQASNNLVLQMGNLDLDIVEGKWETHSGTTETEAQGEAAFINTKPTDVFSKKITIENKGSLKQVLSVNGTNALKHDPIMDYITVNEKVITDLDGKVLNPGEKIDGYIEVGIKDNMPGKFNASGSYNESSPETINFNELSGVFTITANQLEATQSAN